ncbi:TPA: hypothetical protein ACH3X1_014815 [Trebouxia sp. C0004]
MNDFDLNLSERRVMANGTEIPMLVTGQHGDLWFRGNNLTAYLRYAQPEVPLTKILKSRNTKTLAELAPCVVSSMETTPKDDPRAICRYVNEPGLYRLIGRSTMDKAEAFQDWVYEVVLPSIRKTGSYCVQATVPPAEQGDEWHSKRLEGKELMKLKNASLQQLIADGFGQTDSSLYAIAIYSSQSHQPGGARVHRDDHSIQEAADAVRARQRPRPAEHARAGGQMLRRDMFSQVCDRQPVAPEGVVTARPDQGVQGAEAEPETRVVSTEI